MWGDSMIYEWTREELIAQFDEYLDMTQPEVEIMGATFYPSDILKYCDPVMYREEFNNYIDYMQKTDEIFEHSDGKYYTQPELEDAP